MKELPKQPTLYEAMYIVDAAVSDERVQEIVRRLEDHVRESGGEVVATREFGRRQLAYQINHKKTGIYMLLYFRALGHVVEELRNEMRLMDEILRSMIVIANPQAIYDPQALQAQMARAEAEEEAAEEIPAASEDTDTLVSDEASASLDTESAAEAEGEATEGGEISSEDEQQEA